MEQFQRLKEEGNKEFRLKNYTQAKDTFLQVIKDIEGSNEDYESGVSEAGKLYVNLLTNVALACLHIKTEEQYLQAIQVCDKALIIEKNNQKALYRRGLAYKEMGEMVETKNQEEESLTQVYEHYEKARGDLEKVCLLDRNNKLAEEKLEETLKNLARLKVTKQMRKTGEQKKEVKKVSTAKQEKVESKISMKMESIMKDYKVDEVVKLAQEKAEQVILSTPLPVTKTELDKAIKQLSKKPELLKSFFLKFEAGYLQKLDPGFDLLFNVVNSLITVRFEGEQERFGRIVEDIVRVKSFKLVWKGLIESERKDIRSSLQPVLKVREDLAPNFQ